jgi:lipoprotein-anchoring transpeptidase ErfK/SrfK
MKSQLQSKVAPTPADASLKAGVLQRQCACGQHTIAGGECGQCNEKRLQRSALGQAVPAQVPPIVQEVLRSPGQPLDSTTRDFMEQRFHHDFSRVRIHADGRAAESAQAVGANAYTVAQDVVFGSGRFEPGTARGQQLLAHELTHVLQQSGGALQSSSALRAVDPDDRLEAEAQSVGETIQGEAALSIRSLAVPTLQRQPKTAAKPPHITQVVVNQNAPQKVTATFSDGSTKTDQCSTGKGHCCFDEFAGAAEGGACSAARSTQVGNNCTPVGDFLVTAKYPVTGSGINFWTQFHDAKSVALHEYSPVDGTPLSHGCVRLNTEMAKLIYDGARKEVTRVKVEGLAKPLCKDAALQSEWSDDFTEAGTIPPDGEQINPGTGKKYTKDEIARERRHIRGTRKELKSALGVEEAGLDTELAAVTGGTPIVSKIPRCVPALTTEEQQVPAAQKAGFLTSTPSDTATAFTKALNKTRSAATAEAVVRQVGEKLWQDATSASRAGGAGTDDKQIYWTRLMLTTALRQWNPSWSPNADSLRRLHTKLLQLLEQTSRGMTATAFPTDQPDLKRILISGFDPFGFPNPGGDIQQSNLSGAAALALDGETLVEGKVSARVEAVVFPVRYADFNEGIAENFLRPHLTGTQPPHLVVSISQGGVMFEMEEWAGRRRSTETYKENLGLGSGGTETKPVEPPGLAKGAEFLGTNVSPAMLGAMRGAVGRKGAIPEETTVKDVTPGATQPSTHTAGPSATPGQSVEGAGGGFLSNEIFYRNSLLRTQTGSTVPVIHVHTPMLAPGASDKVRNDLIEKTRKILRATLPHL